jgi:hypothetical protein
VIYVVYSEDQTADAACRGRTSVRGIARLSQEAEIFLFESAVTR